MLSHQTDVRGDDRREGFAVGGGYKCCELRCKHYVYGFETAEALRRHMQLHDEAEDARREATLQRRTSNMSLEDGVGGEGPESREASSEEERERVNGRKGSAHGHVHGHHVLSPFSKRAALLPTPDPEGKRRGGGRFSLPSASASSLAGVGLRTAGPCLRCKVLKKKVCLVTLCVMKKGLVGREV